MPAVSDGMRCSSIRGRSTMRPARPSEEPVCEGVEPAQARSPASAGTARNVFMAAHLRSDARPPQRARRRPGTHPSTFALSKSGAPPWPRKRPLTLLRSSDRGSHAGGHRPAAKRDQTLVEGLRLLLLPSALGGLRGAVIAPEARRRRTERRLVFGECRGRLPHLGEQVGELLACRKNRPGRDRLLV